MWISKASGLGDVETARVEGGILTAQEARLIRHSEHQLQCLRIDLHLTAKRREDRLIFDLQQQVALRWGLQDSPSPAAPPSS